MVLGAKAGYDHFTSVHGCYRNGVFVSQELAEGQRCI
jgi:hypothetical protein